MRPRVYVFAGEAASTVLVEVSEPCCPPHAHGQHPAGGPCCQSDEPLEGGAG